MNPSDGRDFSHISCSPDQRIKCPIDASINLPLVFRLCARALQDLPYRGGRSGPFFLLCDCHERETRAFPSSTIYHVLLFFPDVGAIKGERMMQGVTVLVALRCGAMRLAGSCSHTLALYVHEAGVGAGAYRGGGGG